MPKANVRTKESVERYNIDNCDAVFGGNRFQLILAASIRAQEIAKNRVTASRNAPGNAQPVYANRPSVEALLEFEHGKASAENYMAKIGKQKQNKY